MSKEQGFRYPRPMGAVQRTMGMFAEHATLGAVSLLSLLPLYFMLKTSFFPPDNFDASSFALPLAPTLENYRMVLGSLGFSRMTFNSSVLALSTATLATIVGAGAAFGLLQLRRRLAMTLTAIGYGLMAIPPIVVIVPVFLLVVKVGLIDSYVSGVVVMTALLTPFNVVLLYTYMRSLPEETIEAAYVDGAGRWAQFRHIILPLSRPPLVTAFMISAIFAWNDLLVPLILWPSEKLQTLMVGLAILGPGRSGLRDVPLLMAGVTISVVPLLLMFLIARRSLLRGLVQGVSR